MNLPNRRCPLPAAGAALGCLLLTACAGQGPTATNWVKTGADDQTIAIDNTDASDRKWARPGAVASGSVTFSDGNSAAWYLDQLGRLGLAPKKQGYKPPASDLQEFQTELQLELAKMGF